MFVSSPLPEPFRLVLEETGELSAYACRVCGLIVTPLTFGGVKPLSVERAEQYAREHCSRRCTCGKTAPKGRSRCDACWKEEEEKRDLRRFELVDKLLESEYEGPVYWAGHRGSLGPDYFATAEEVHEYCRDENVELPHHVWACRQVAVALDVDGLLRQAFFGHHEEARDRLEPRAEEELGCMLRWWCDQYKVGSWQVDFTRAIVLEEG